MGSEITPSEARSTKKEERRRIIIALLFLLLSCGCVFCSSQTALWLIDRSTIQGSMLSTLRADYGPNGSLALAPLSSDIIAEAAQDEAQLTLKQTPLASGLDVAILPNPIPTPIPTLVALLPTPTPTPTTQAAPNPVPATPTSVAVLPTATAAPPTSTAAPPTATTLPPTATPPLATPTLAPLTPSPTTLPPTPSATAVLPTVTATSLPPTTTSTSTTAPPTPTGTLIPTQTDTPTATGTATPTATATATPTATDTATATATATPTDTPTATPTNTPIPPSVQFSAATYSVSEAGGSVTITVNLSASTSTTVTVNYATSDGTANAGSDYTTASGVLTFSPGQTSQTFAVPITNDATPEVDETVNLTLSSPSGATLGSPGSATLTIVDNDVTCPGQYPTGEPNLGAPNGVFALIGCQAGLIVNLGSNPITINGDNNPDFDFVYYESRPVPPATVPPPPNVIFMDIVEIQIGQTPSGPWYTVMYWGDNINDANTNIFPTYPDLGPNWYQAGGSDNQPMAAPPLYTNPGAPAFPTGVQIDVDNVPTGSPPPGSYQYIRIYSPAGGSSDGPEIDAIEVLP